MNLLRFYVDKHNLTFIRALKNGLEKGGENENAISLKVNRDELMKKAKKKRMKKMRKRHWTWSLMKSPMSPLWMMTSRKKTRTMKTEKAVRAENLLPNDRS